MAHSIASTPPANTDSRVFVPLFHGVDPEPKRGRGRPRGSKALVVQDPRAMGVHHFAFVRSSILGLDLADSFARYMAWSDSTTDLRHIQHRREALRKQIIEAGRQFDATLPAHAKITHLLDLLRSDATVKPAVVLPSLDEWIEAEGMDPEGWSEAELLAEYRAAFGLDNVDAMEAAAGLKDPVGERVRALNYLETVLATTPAPTDRLETWFAKPVVKCLRNVGIVTLADLVAFINVHGYQWHARIKGVGVHRARQVLSWLVLQQDNLNSMISGTVYEPRRKQVLRVADLLPAVGSASAALTQFGAGTQVANALARMQSSPTLSGATGVFRSHMANTLGASNDIEAVDTWLQRYKEKPATHSSYRKEVERFLLWCAQELKKPLSSVTAVDCQRYRDFQKNVPSTWIAPLPLKRTDPRWRAFRSQPSAASQKQALVILQTMFGGLVDAGYLVANPMRALMKSFDLPASKMDISRSFTEAEWSYVLLTLDALPVGPECVRLKCMLELLVTSGIRLDELAKARQRDMRVEALPGLPETWILTVTGKRNKTREVPLMQEVVDLLAAHGREFLEEDKLLASQADVPLIRTLHLPVPQWGRGPEGELVLAASTQRTGLPLTASAIYITLKRFFKKAAKSAGAVGLDARRFEKASTHWMRHTFVRQSLVDGMPIEIASELAGHASIDTTSIYATQELARKIKAVRGMKRRVAARPATIRCWGKIDQGPQ